MKKLIIVFALISLSSCVALEQRQRLINYRNKEDLIKKANSYCAQYGKPDEVSWYDPSSIGGDESITYTYHCYKGQYISVEITHYNVSVYKSNGICD